MATQHTERIVDASTNGGHKKGTHIHERSTLTDATASTRCSAKAAASNGVQKERARMRLRLDMVASQVTSVAKKKNPLQSDMLSLCKRNS